MACSAEECSGVPVITPELLQVTGPRLAPDKSVPSLLLFRLEQSHCWHVPKTFLRYPSSASIQRGATLPQADSQRNKEGPQGWNEELVGCTVPEVRHEERGQGSRHGQPRSDPHQVGVGR